jgi:GH25 family lysozyme M1 (1,4-beta-N-acetylmuramidase)
MKTIIASIVLLLALSHAALATKGVDLSTLSSASAFTCMRNNGYGGFAIPRVATSVGTIDHNGIQSVINAHAGGMAHVDGYIFPCPHCGDPEGQIKRAVAALRSAGATIGMLWLDIEGTQYWKDQNYNRNFFAGLINGCHAAGVTIGVYTSASQWNPIMGASTAGSSYPLWYAHYDNNPSFSDFRGFGGWTHPSIKQYKGTTTLCGVGVDLSWYP